MKGRYASFVDANNENIAYTIGRSMYETDRIPANWVNNANNLVDKLWVMCPHAYFKYKRFLLSLTFELSPKIL